MKIAFIFGKGIDGCGVTKGAHIFEDWLVSKGHTTLIVDFDNDQSFVRAKDTTWKGDVLRVEKHHNIQDMKNIISTLNEYDIAIFHSHPTRKQFNYVDRYREFVSQILNPIIVMHDHAITKNNINMIPQATELFAMADIGVVQSFNGFSKEAYTTIDKSFTERIIENPIWIKPYIYDKYRKSFDERRKHFLYIGRMSSIKDPAMIPRMEPYLSGWELSLIGCEKSISSVSYLTDSLETNPAPYVPEFKDKILFHTLNKKDVYNIPKGELNKNTTIKSYDRYKYDFGMNELGSSIASWCGYRLQNPSEYGHRMEYTMIESYLLSLPVISRHFAENAFSPEGKLWKYYDCALISQAREEENLADELNRICNSKNEWEERTKACQELIYKFNDIDVIGQQFLDFVIQKGKRNNKIDFIESIKDFFPSAKNRRERGEILLTSCNNIINKTPAVLIQGRQHILKEENTTLESFF